MNWYNEVIENITAYGSIAFYLPIIILLIKFNPSLSVTLFFSMLAVELLTGGIKLFYNKPRPKPRVNRSWIEKVDAGSFPSTHTARITALSFILNLAYPFTLGIIISAILILAVGYSRIYLKHHYFFDVFGGFVIGILIGAINLLI